MVSVRVRNGSRRLCLPLTGCGLNWQPRRKLMVTLICYSGEAIPLRHGMYCSSSASGLGFLQLPILEVTSDIP